MNEKTGERQVKVCDYFNSASSCFLDDGHLDRQGFSRIHVCQFCYEKRHKSRNHSSFICTSKESKASITAFHRNETIQKMPVEKGKVVSSRSIAAKSKVIKSKASLPTNKKKVVSAETSGKSSVKSKESCLSGADVWKSFLENNLSDSAPAEAKKNVTN